MKYKCKKPYNNKFVVNEYYSSDQKISDGFIVIGGYWFYDFKEIKKCNINEYFYTESEIRKEKLQKLQTIE